ncbi:hypothetical protein [Kutzneria sp. NPDC052558]|uniref:hypothetical protein n=1 Tax=Kutzneria sp. NPDC052558 TaxID=3364121 RepID=UPI0037C8BD6A
MSAPGLVATTTRSTPSPPARHGPWLRGRWWLVAGGVVILAGSLAGVQAYVVAQNQTIPVLALARDVGWGHRLVDGDLVVAQVIPDEHVRTVDAGERDQVLGQTAVRTLAAGTLLARAELTTARVPAAGQVVVGVLLKPGGLPAAGVRPQDRVLLTPTTASSGMEVVAPVIGVVLDSGSPNADGSLVVDVIVDGAPNPIAAPAGVGQVVLSLLGPDGR